MSTLWFLMSFLLSVCLLQVHTSNPSAWWEMSLGIHYFYGVTSFTESLHLLRAKPACFLLPFAFGYLHCCRNENQSIFYEQEKGHRPQQTPATAKANWKYPPQTRLTSHSTSGNIWRKKSSLRRQSCEGQFTKTALRNSTWINFHCLFQMTLSK